MKPHTRRTCGRAVGVSVEQSMHCLSRCAPLRPEMLLWPALRASARSVRCVACLARSLSYCSRELKTKVLTKKNIYRCYRPSAHLSICHLSLARGEPRLSVSALCLMRAGEMRADLSRAFWGGTGLHGGARLRPMSRQPRVSARGSYRQRTVEEREPRLRPGKSFMNPSRAERLCRICSPQRPHRPSKAHFQLACGHAVRRGEQIRYSRYGP